MGVTLWLRHLGLRVRFAAALAVVVLLVTVLFGWIVGQHSVEQYRDRIGHSLISDSQRVSDRLSKEMLDRARDLGLIATLEPMRSLHDVAGMQSLLDGLRRSEPSYLWIAVTDVQGRVLAATDGGLVGNDMSGLPDLRDQLRGRPTSVNDPLRVVRPNETDVDTSVPDKPQQLNISRPIRTGDGTVVGVIVAQLSWEWLRNGLRGILPLDRNGTVERQIVVVSSQDAVLIGPADLLGRRLSLPQISRARAGIFNWAVEPWPDGTKYISGASFAAGDGAFPGAGTVPMRWTVLVREPSRVALAPARELEDSILVLALGLTAIVAAFGWLIAGVITRPLRQIAAAADRLRFGESAELPNLCTSREVEILSASLRALVASLTFKQGKLDELETATQHDGLTGLLNRTGLQNWLAHAMALARTERSGLLVLAADLDGFKQINDTLGHAGGDTLLQQVGHRLQGSVRARDAVARTGGDEFVVVLHAPRGLDDRQALDTANRLWDRVVQPYLVEGVEAVVGLSLGGASWPEDERQIDHVLTKADAALYTAKRAGKNRIVFSHGMVAG